jgi:beta-lactamase class A
VNTIVHPTLRKTLPRRIFLLVLAIVLSFPPAKMTAASGTIGPTLLDSLQTLIKSFHGDIGLYIHNFKTDLTLEVNADSLFPSASLIKVPIMVGLFDRVQQGELDYNSELLYRDSLLFPGNDILGSFKDSTVIGLARVVMLMMTMSDNTAGLWCQSLAGGGTAINEWLEGNGYHQTRVNSKTPGREAERKKYGWGQTTPHEMADLVTMIRDGKAVSPSASDRMFRFLSRSYWDGEALAEIPAYVHVASKQGSINRSRSEVVFVDAPSGDYVLSIITNEQSDQRWTKDNEGSVLIRRISRLLWNAFEPSLAPSPSSSP